MALPWRYHGTIADAMQIANCAQPGVNSTAVAGKVTRGVSLECCAGPSTSQEFECTSDSTSSIIDRLFIDYIISKPNYCATGCNNKSLLYTKKYEMVQLTFIVSRVLLITARGEWERKWERWDVAGLSVVRGGECGGSVRVR